MAPTLRPGESPQSSPIYSDLKANDSDPGVNTKTPPPTKKTGKRPDRQRPGDNMTEAMRFLAVATTYMNDSKVPLQKASLGELTVLWRRYVKNTGIRGRQKDLIWKIASAQISKLREIMT